MKILMTADTLGGVWTYTLELCAGLKPLGAEIALATMGRKLSSRQRTELASLDHVRLFESDYRLCWMPEPWVHIEQATQWLLEIEAEFQPDLIHLNDLGHGGIGWKAPMLLVAHSCVCSWWQAVKGEPAPSPDWDRYRMPVRAGCRKAGLIVAPSRAMLTAFQDQHGKHANARVIHNGRSFPQSIAADPADGRHKAPLFFAAGRLWDSAKNISLLAEVAPWLQWPVYVAGEQETPEGERYCPNSIRLLGRLDAESLGGWLRKASVYVLPARYEPFGLSILEAARAGCALVLGDIPSLREIWGDAACYVHPDDGEQLKQVLNQLAMEPGRRRHLAQKALQRAQQYSTDNMTSAYWACYRELIQRVPEGNSRMDLYGPAKIAPGRQLAKAGTDREKGVPA